MLKFQITLLNLSLLLFGMHVSTPLNAQSVLFNMNKSASIEKAYTHIEKGNLLLDSGHVDDALTQFKAACVLIPDNPRPYYYIGFLKTKQGNLEEAELVFQKALNLWPDYPEANASLGAVYLKYNAYEKAYPYLKKALTLNPNLADVKNNLGGYFLLFKHNLDSAAHYFERAIENDSLFADAFINLANVYLQQSKLEAANLISNHALSIAPEYASAHFLAGNVHFKKASFKKCIFHYQQSLRLNPALYEIHYNLGRAHLFLNDIEQAKLSLKKLEPHNVKLATLLKELIRDKSHHIN